MDFSARFEQGLDYDEFLGKYATEVQRCRWDGVFNQIQLTAAQKKLLVSFQREMRVLVVAGTWCGDCVEQCPIFAHFRAQNSNIVVRFFDRDDHPDLAQALSICGGARVPSLLVLSEDGFVCGRAGDRTLSKYRQIASEQFGAACATGAAAVDETLLQAVTQDWLDEFERIQLMLRTSGRLRQLHGD
jgi:hypothetical protein